MIGRGRFHVLDEGRYASVAGAADADAFPGSGQLVRAGVGARLRVGDVDRVVLRDGDAARPPELAPFGQEASFLIENLDTVVLPIADEQPALRVHGDGVWLADLARARAFVAPFLQERAVPVELDHPVVAAVAMAVGNEQAAVR